MAPQGKLLDGKTVLITGAGRGIGQAIAEAFAEQGATLILAARSEDQLQETAKSCKEKGAKDAEVHSLDMTKPENIEEFCKKLHDKHGYIYGLVNNAGMSPPGGNGPVEGDISKWEMALKLNVLAPMQFTRCLAPQMQEKHEGLIINMGSVAAIEPSAGMAVYTATKHGLRGWSLSCYQALRKDNIKVVLINPGMVETGMTEGMGDSEKMIKPRDIALGALLAVETSTHACPQEITIRPVEPAA
jgi:short-subunit dehydrogenase